MVRLSGFVIALDVSEDVSLRPLVAPNGPYSRPTKDNPVASLEKGSEFVVNIERRDNRVFISGQRIDKESMSSEDAAFVFNSAIRDLEAYGIL